MVQFLDDSGVSRGVHHHIECSDASTIYMVMSFGSSAEKSISYTEACEQLPYRWRCVCRRYNTTGGRAVQHETQFPHEPSLHNLDNVYVNRKQRSEIPGDHGMTAHSTRIEDKTSVLVHRQEGATIMSTARSGIS